MLILFILLIKEFTKSEDYNSTKLLIPLLRIEEKINCSCYEEPKWKTLFLESFMVYNSCPLTQVLDSECECTPLDLYFGECVCDCVDAICYGYDSSDTSTCSGHGVCIRTNKCLCLPGYSGNKCQLI